MQTPPSFSPDGPDSRLPARRGDAGLPASAYYHIDTPPPAEPAAEPETGGVIEYWYLLRRYKGTLLLFAVLGTIAALLISLPQTPIYQARGTLEILSVNEDLLNKRQLDPTSTMQDWSPELNIKTQMSILQSRSLSDRVEAKMRAQYKGRPPVDTSRLTAWRKALGLAPAASSPPADNKDTGTALPGGSLSVQPITDTRLVQVVYDSPDPKYAADYVNTLTNEFIDQNVEVRYQASMRTGEWLSRQIDDLKIKLERSEDELQQYARTAGLQFTGEKDSVAEEKLKQVQEELSKAQADRTARQSRYEVAVSTPPETLPEVLDDKLMGDLQAKLTDLRRQLAELSAALTPAHYKVTRTQEQINSLEAALNRQRANVIARIRNEYDAAVRREKLLAEQYAAQSKFVSDQSEKSIHYGILKREVDTSRQLYEGMLQKVKEYGIASAMHASNLRVVDSARPPGFPYKPDYVRSSGLGLLAGLLLGVAFVIVRERADRAIQAPGETGLYTNVPELGIIPAASYDAQTLHMYRGRQRSHSLPQKREVTPAEFAAVIELSTGQRKHSLIAESFRTAIASILLPDRTGDQARVIVVTSPSPKEGKSTVASNLALALCAIQRRVLLIDADLRRPRLHSLFGLSNDQGLIDLLKSPLPLNGEEGVVGETSYPHLYVMPAGPPEHAVFNLLHSPRLPELLNRLRKDFDNVIIDTPPMLNMSDARIIGRFSDGVILVIRAGQTTRDTMRAAIQRLAEDGIAVLGTILNDWHPEKNVAYGYGYAYRSYGRSYKAYYKHYGEDSEKKE
jgi:succinoglycan biosynthesis transport protein ExoP